MAVIIGLTGGIGSGKTIIMNYIETLGYKTYYADDAGKKVMENPEIVTEITKLLGKEILENGRLDRKKISAAVFADPQKLKNLNNIIHPAVKKDFENVVKVLPEKEIIVKESAILFESGAYKQCDYTILVTAPEDVRIERVMQRDKVSFEEVKSRIRNQWTDEEKAKLAHFVVQNLNLNQAFIQISDILNNILRN